MQYKPLLCGVIIMAKKIIKVSKHHIKDNEDWFNKIDFDNPIEVALGRCHNSRHWRL